MLSIRYLLVNPGPLCVVGVCGAGWAVRRRGWKLRVEGEGQVDQVWGGCGGRGWEVGQAPRGISVLPQSVGTEAGPRKWYGGVFSVRPSGSLFLLSCYWDFFVFIHRYFSVILINEKWHFLFLEYLMENILKISSCGHLSRCWIWFI